MANNRIYYAIHAVAIKEDSAGTAAFAADDLLHGVQSVGMSTNFNLVQVFGLGALEIYENIENIPDVEVTLSKVLDGYPLIYHQATKDTTSIDPTLAGRQTSKAIFGMAITDEANEYVSATNEVSVVQCSGMYVSSVSYTFNVDDNFTEDVTLVCNDKVWLNTPDFGGNLNPDLPTPDWAANMTSSPSPIGEGGVNRKENLLWTATGAGTDTNGMNADPDATILPPDVFGISSTGVNDKTADVYGAHVSSITVSVDLGRESIDELGRRAPYYRFITFPTEVTCDVEVTSSSGDMVSATEDGIWTTGTACGDDLGNLKDRTIRIATCEGTRIYLGIKNKLSSVNYTGGDAGGGNVSVSYSFQTFNDFTVMHTGDPHPSGVDGSWWAARATYLVN